MIVSETSGYNNTLKKIKNNHEARKKLNNILNHFEDVNNFDELKNHVVSNLYGFEVLTGDLSGYCRFSLDKNGKVGKLRLIFSCSNDSVKLEYISDEHYADFKRYLREMKR